MTLTLTPTQSPSTPPPVNLIMPEFTFLEKETAKVNLEILKYLILFCPLLLSDQSPGASLVKRR